LGDRRDKNKSDMVQGLYRAAGLNKRLDGISIAVGVLRIPGRNVGFLDEYRREKGETGRATRRSGAQSSVCRTWRETYSSFNHVLVENNQKGSKTGGTLTSC
jgi:hypothetical protein